MMRLIERVRFREHAPGWRMSAALSVSGRRRFVFLLKDLVEIPLIVIADKFCNFVHALVGGGQHMLCMRKPDLLDICRVGQSGLALDDPVEVILLKMEFADQVLYGDGRVVPLDVV